MAQLSNTQSTRQFSITHLPRSSSPGWSQLKTAVLLTALACSGLISLPGSADGYTMEQVASGLDNPVYMTQAPGETNIIHYVEMQDAAGVTSRIRTLDLNSGTSSPFLDIGLTTAFSGGVRGLAFHPNYETNGKFYVSRTDEITSGTPTNLLDEYQVVGGTPQFVRNLLTDDSDHFVSHDINWIGFLPTATGGEKDHLYIAKGDGVGFPPGISAQDLDNLRGKILRIDVGDGLDDYPADPNKNFGIPPSNPFVDGDPTTLDEVFHSGLRNPWRASFDRDTGDMLIGDVQDLWFEEINFIRAGEMGQDFGWPKRQGTIENLWVGGPQGDSINPIYEYPHLDETNAVVGGYVYRGPISELEGQYFFADQQSGGMWSADFDRDADPTTFDGTNISNFTDRTSEFNTLAGANTIDNPVSFGEDNAGNLYIIDFGSNFGGGGIGEIYRLVDDSCLVGDANCDGYVDTAGDILTAFSNYTGPGSFGKTRAEGDVHGTPTGATSDLDPHDGDVDVTDILTMFGAFTGPAPDAAGLGDLWATLTPAAAGDPGIPDLIYDPATGEVILDPDGAAIIGYSLKSGGLFLPGGHTPILGGVSTSLATELAEAALSSPGSAMSIGFVFPTGLDLAGLVALLSENTVSTGLGAPLVPFDLVVLGPAVPEPASGLLAAIALAALGCVACHRRRRRAA